MNRKLLAVLKRQPAGVADQRRQLVLIGLVPLVDSTVPPSVDGQPVIEHALLGRQAFGALVAGDGAVIYGRLPVDPLEMGS